jgi:pantetheine-phosphate adenylyltransferase
MLLKKAFQIAGPRGTVFIGITSPGMIQKKGNFASFNKRKHAIEKFLEEEQWLHQAMIQQISDKFGPTLKTDFDVIVVSPETEPTAKQINTTRKHLGLKPLRIIVIPFIFSADGKPISSSRIRRMEIDENGALLQ